MDGPDLSISIEDMSNAGASRRMRSMSGDPTRSCPGAPLPNNERESWERFGQRVTARAKEV